MKNNIFAITTIFVSAILLGATIQLGARLFMEFFPNPPLTVEHNYHYSISDAKFDKELANYLNQKQKEKQ